MYTMYIQCIYSIHYVYIVHTVYIQSSSSSSCCVTQGVFGIGKKKKSPIGFERVVRTLGNPKLSKRPPEEVCISLLSVCMNVKGLLHQQTWDSA